MFRTDWHPFDGQMAVHSFKTNWNSSIRIDIRDPTCQRKGTSTLETRRDPCLLLAGELHRILQLLRRDALEETREVIERIDGDTTTTASNHG